MLQELLIGAPIIIVAVGAYKLLAGKCKSGQMWPKDTVVLYQIGRGPRAPSLSPFPIKLETYLRIAKIPYVNDQSRKMSSKNKTPWISYNGEAVADSQLCIQYLNKKLDINLSSHLDDTQKAVACAFQRLVDEHYYWCIVLWRWVFDKSDFLQVAFQQVLKSYWLSAIFVKIVKRMVKKQTIMQGMGRHSYDEVFQIAEEDLSSVSIFLGNKKYLMGDKVCEQDCALFGHLAQTCFQLGDECPLKKLVDEKFPNLKDYVFRMRDEFWPDWEECHSSDYTKTPTK